MTAMLTIVAFNVAMLHFVLDRPWSGWSMLLITAAFALRAMMGEGPKEGR